MPTTTPAVKIVDALTEGSAAVLGAARAANERGYRFSKAVIEEVERGQQEALELGRTFVRDPSNLSGFSSALVEKATEARGRAMEFGRMWLRELSDAGQEAREAAQRVTQANREAAEAAFAAVRDLVQQGTANVQHALQREQPEPVRPTRSTQRTSHEISTN